MQQTKTVAQIKRRTLQLSSGKQVKLFGNSIAISKSLEVGEGYAPNILSSVNQGEHTNTTGITNPHQLTSEELFELADYNIRL